MEQVDIIVGKYEWFCPKCENFNEEIELPIDSLLECQECRETFEMNPDIQHAYNK